MPWRFSTTEIGTELVTLSELKDHLHIDDTAEDDMLEALCTQARQFVEDQTGYLLVDREVTASIKTPFTDRYKLPSSVSSITSLKYWDGDGTEYTVDSSNYMLDTTAREIIIVGDFEFPTVVKKIEVIYMSPAIEAKEKYVTAIKVYATAVYENREGIPQGDFIGIQRYIANIKNAGWR